MASAYPDYSADSCVERWSRGDPLVSPDDEFAHAAAPGKSGGHSSGPGHENVITRVIVGRTGQPAAPLRHRKQPHVACAALTVLKAAVGYGKTTLLRSWCAERPEPVIWLTLDRSDDETATDALMNDLGSVLVSLAPADGEAVTVAAKPESRLSLSGPFSNGRGAGASPSSRSAIVAQ